MGATKPKRGTELEPALRDLLDHIATELAHEYIRLMEQAAKVGTPAEPEGEKP